MGETLEHRPSLENPIWEQVGLAIESLAPDHRQIVQFHYEQGLSQSEIASKLGVSVGTVNMRLHAARSRLKRRLNHMKEEIATASTPGRIHEVSDRLITVQFPPNAPPPIQTRLTGLGQDSLCVVQNLGAGQVLAVSSRLGSIWTPGQEVTACQGPYSEPIDDLAVTQLIGSVGSAKSAEPLETGIKSIDVFAPMTQSGRTGIFAEWGLGVLVLLPELLRNIEKEHNRQTIFVFLPPMKTDQHWRELDAEVTLGSRTISVVYVPVADSMRQDFIDSVTGLNSKLVLARRLSEQSIWPCIDPLGCWSTQFESDSIGAELSTRVQELFRTYYRLQFSIGPSDRHALTDDETLLIQRGRKALRFLSQPFFVAEPYTKRPGAFVTALEARRGFEGILSGDFDDVHKDAFYMTGGLPKAS
jgi:F0F1-type ATP synthase beta subunit